MSESPFIPSSVTPAPVTSPKMQEESNLEMDSKLPMFGWMHKKVRTMLTELNSRLKEYDVTVPRAGSRKIAVQITESARKASEAEQALLNAEDPDAAASNKYGLKS